MVPYSHSKTIASYGEHVTFEQKESRMQEIVESIRKTLIHPEVGKVYLFYQDELLIPYMEKQNLDHKEKMVFVPNMEDTMATLFRYANEHLDGHVVMVMNADTYPDEGFEKLDFTRLRGKNLIYSLSRSVVIIIFQSSTSGLKVTLEVNSEVGLRTKMLHL